MKKVNLTEMTVRVRTEKGKEPAFRPVIAGKAIVRRGKKQPRR